MRTDVLYTHGPYIGNYCLANFIPEGNGWNVELSYSDGRIELIGWEESKLEMMRLLRMHCKAFGVNIKGIRISSEKPAEGEERL